MSLQNREESDSQASEDDHVEITFAYGMPTSEGDLQQINKTEFQENMMSCLKKVGMDE